MIILGLHFGHDAAVTIMKDGVVLSVIEKERVTRIKHAAGLDYQDILLALERTDIELDQIDYCAVTCTQGMEYIFFHPDKLSFEIDYSNEINSPCLNLIQKNNLTIKGESGFLEGVKNKNKAEFEPQRQRLKQYIEQGLVETAQTFDSIENFFSSETWTKVKSLRDISSTNYSHLIDDNFRKGFHLPIELILLGKKIKGILLSHHYAHAAYAFFESEFQNAAIFSHDGDSRALQGYRSGMFYYGEGTKIYPITPHYLALGYMYEVVSSFIGFDLVSGPGKMMGLTSYGQPNFFMSEFVGNWYDRPERFEKEIVNARETFSVPNLWINIALNLAKARGYDLTRLAQKEYILDPINADIASSIQKTFEETMFYATEVLMQALQASSIRTKNLCLTGGVMLNCPTNSKIYNESSFEKVFIPPACGDPGLSTGAAYALYYCILDNPRNEVQRSAAEKIYLGINYSEEETLSALNMFSNSITYEKLLDPSKDAAEQLAENKIIGWYEGRCELGPRALGHRSILANPQFVSNWEKVNIIKRREYWRPLAPAVLVEECEKWYKAAPVDSPFMLFNARVKSYNIPAVTHVDNTARIQTVSPDNGMYYNVIKSFYEITGVPVVLNTSFNGPGEPIVETPENAIRMFLDTDIDAIYINGYKIVKK
ncbi:carbamoyltransferase C-terminal domain-containing protein [Paenibacillus ehimensis]|uniref:Carbamoyltransferase C-terminal domain-containing protein n=1 Tax=Paenibacillus ehimensis TaxID=79264 RepID=A0ABT8VCX1_9BACL|nr:carbamoyltransferase C-terminal domain-containing protein [Paenibacillus ehimensis]MDO3678809.1 carbamoyltransferase C-terminal domain-containing protein [Paenibacillus ehimensis]MEC0209444.1 carbamoyltransferase C-terminal domain-containing protein [Paenibacillus ehimensis]